MMSVISTREHPGNGITGGEKEKVGRTRQGDRQREARNGWRMQKTSEYMEGTMKKLVWSSIGLCLLFLAALAGLGGCTLSPVGVQRMMNKGLALQPPASMADFEHLVGLWQGTYTEMADLQQKPSP
jgi:hypothetical protein